jgi:tetratricopeptide (TPR) repeat protein
LALLQLAAQDLEGAEASLRTCLELEPDWAQPVVLLARTLSSQRRQEEARELLKTALDRQPDESTLRTTYARMLVDQQRYSEALVEFKKLHQQAPDDADVLYAMGMLAVQTEQWEDAREAWQALRGNHERAAEATYFLAQIEEVSGNKTLAMGLYAAVSDDKLRTDAALRLAQLKVDSGQMKDAREVLQRARVLDPDRSVEIYLTEAQLLQQEKRRDLALETYRVALAAHPENVDLLYNRALYAAEFGRIDWLERDLMRVLELEPDNADALNALGYTLADQTDRHQEAFAFISRAYKLKPDSAAILDSMGWVYYRLGDYDKALEFLRRALATMMDSEIAAHLGEVLWVTGEREEAKKVWLEALQEDPMSDDIRSVMERLK